MSPGAPSPSSGRALALGLLLAPLAALAEPLSAPDLERGRVVVEFVGVEGDRGRVQARIFAGPEGFPSDGAHALQQGRVDVGPGPLRIVFDALPYGEYAVAGCHDADADGDCDTNWLGLPTEAVAVSNDAFRRFGPPLFEDARFPLDAPVTRITLRLRYGLATPGAGER